MCGSTKASLRADDQHAVGLRGQAQACDALGEGHRVAVEPGDAHARGERERRVGRVLAEQLLADLGVADALQLLCAQAPLARELEVDLGVSVDLPVDRAGGGQILEPREHEGGGGLLGLGVLGIGERACDLFDEDRAGILQRGEERFDAVVLERPRDPRRVPGGERRGLGKRLEGDLAQLAVGAGGELLDARAVLLVAQRDERLGRQRPDEDGLAHLGEAVLGELGGEAGAGLVEPVLLAVEPQHLLRGQAVDAGLLRLAVDLAEHGLGLGQPFAEHPQRDQGVGRKAAVELPAQMRNGLLDLGLAELEQVVGGDALAGLERRENPCGGGLGPAEEEIEPGKLLLPGVGGPGLLGVLECSGQRRLGLGLELLERGAGLRRDGVERVELPALLLREPLADEERLDERGAALGAQRGTGELAGVAVAAAERLGAAQVQVEREVLLRGGGVVGEQGLAVADEGPGALQEVGGAVGHEAPRVVVSA
ncbi:MAG: hypothetical protein QM765_35800 [Myxococcales bacterium]